MIDLLCTMMLKRDVWKIVLHIEGKILSLDLLSFYAWVAPVSLKFVACSYSTSFCCRRLLVWISSDSWVNLSAIHDGLWRLGPHRWLTKLTSLIQKVLLGRWRSIVKVLGLALKWLPSVGIFEINLTRGIQSCIPTILMAKWSNWTRNILKHVKSPIDWDCFLVTRLAWIPDVLLFNIVVVIDKVLVLNDLLCARMSTWFCVLAVLSRPSNKWRHFLINRLHRYF